LGKKATPPLPTPPLTPFHSPMKRKWGRQAVARSTKALLDGVVAVAFKDEEMQQLDGLGGCLADRVKKRRRVVTTDTERP
jgi:hypothetical protein